jgi:hypothetical protein
VEEGQLLNSEDSDQSTSAGSEIPTFANFDISNPITQTHYPILIKTKKKVHITNISILTLVNEVTGATF